MRTGIANLLSFAETVVRGGPSQTNPHHPFARDSTTPGATDSALPTTQTASEVVERVSNTPTVSEVVERVATTPKASEVGDNAKGSRFGVMHIIHMQTGDTDSIWMHFYPGRMLNSESPNAAFTTSKLRFSEGGEREKETMTALQLMDVLVRLGRHPREALESYIRKESEKAGEGKHLGIGLIRVFKETDSDGKPYTRTIILTLVKEDGTSS